MGDPEVWEGNTHGETGAGVKLYFLPPEAEVHTASLQTRWSTLSLPPAVPAP